MQDGTVNRQPSIIGLAPRNTTSHLALEIRTEFTVSVEGTDRQPFLATIETGEVAQAHKLIPASVDMRI